MVQYIDTFSNNISLYIKRDDLLHPLISGNKYRKLKYNIEYALLHGYSTLLTFGGAYSNHILAVAAAAHENGLKSIGVIRGEELIEKIDYNPTLYKAKQLGMSFDFVSRENYRNKTSIDFVDYLKNKFDNFYLIPEGGTNELAIIGTQEIVSEENDFYDYIVCAVGTGGTISGIIKSSSINQKIIGISSLRNSELNADIFNFVNNEVLTNWSVNFDFTFGGYGKVKPELISFINAFYKQYKIPLDPVYTGKMMCGVVELIKQNYFKPNTKILTIHTGGLQGVEGMNQLLKSKNEAQILFDV